MAPEERKRHRRPSAADETNSDDDNDAPIVSPEDLVNLAFQQVPSLEPQPTPEIDPGSDSKIRHGTFDIHWDPRLSCRVVDFIGDIEVRRMRPAIRCPFHSTPVLSPHRVDVNPSVGGLASGSWGRLPKSDLAEEATHECLATICGATIPAPSLVPTASHENMVDSRPSQSRVSVYQYTLNKAKPKTSLRNDDGAFAFIPQTGPVTLDTELGLLELQVGDVGVVPAGIHLSISPSKTAGAEVLSGGCAGYVLEVVGTGFDLAADSDFAVASGPLSHDEGPLDADGKEWTHFVKDSSAPRPPTLPSYMTASGAIPAWMPPNPPPSHRNTARRPKQHEKEAEEKCDGGQSEPATDGKLNPLRQYTLAHGPLDVVAWEVEGSRCEDLPYKVRMSVPGPDQREPWPVLRADHGDGHVTELRMFDSRVQTPLWDAPNAAAAAASSSTSHVPDDAGAGDREKPRDGLNVAYGVIRGPKGDQAWRGLRAGDLVVQAPGAKDAAAAAVVPDPIPHSDPSQCHDLLGFSFTFPGKLGFSEWALAEHPARISSTTT
ncbi:hypothetical protein M0657_009883 [Pyricularia oryzae]|uniref:Homogentisate 1,2-dioxygenase N-terminal domain-containing protein n=2 Tax=Pyricularia oryzae TaxID=318829 RepID=A0AA97P2M6_PYRO3|nr:hypothetical protein OOU_Y34scaffold00334g28 [Pyricularia oryzae Y34]KAI7913701.1 hypothetical protein M0657_009883 [Pyricularia oryzae]KAI7918438.1 hypothetical protein M9X92_006916 [Pyricularia oryzae]